MGRRISTQTRTLSKHHRNESHIYCRFYSLSLLCKPCLKPVAQCLDAVAIKIKIIVKINHKIVYHIKAMTVSTTKGLGMCLIFALKTDNSFFCHRDIPTIHNGYCVSNAVDYAKKINVLPTILSTFSLDLRGQ